MNKKKLIELKNELQSEAKSIIDEVSIETRALSEDEEKRIEAIELQIESISQVLDQMDLIKESKEVKDGGNKDMNTDVSAEKRSIAEGILSGEYRSMNTNTNANTIPSFIAKEVIKKMFEISNVFNDSTVVTDVKGNLEYLIEHDPVLAKMLDEDEELKEDDVKFSKVILKDKRMGSLVKISNMMLKNNENISIDYLINTLAERIVRQIENQIFNGTGGTKSFTSGLESSSNVVETAAVGVVAIDDLMKMVSSMSQLYLNGCKWYMSRDMFQIVSSMKDDNGHFYLTLSQEANQTPVYRLFGLAIEVTNSVKAPAILANLKAGYRIKLSENSNFSVLNEVYATQGMTGVMASFYGDGAVVDDNCIVKLQIKK